jgi:two-component system sensor histidine kinase UhpB
MRAGTLGWAMARHVCVAWDDSPPARWALAFAANLARESGARLTIAHVTAPAGECDLLDLGEDGRVRRSVQATAAMLPLDIDVRVRLLAGRPAEQLVALVHAEQIDMLVVGTRPLRGWERLLAPRLRHELLATAPCPVVLVRRPTVRGDACVDAEPERWHGLRRRLGMSRIDALVEQSGAPVRVAPIVHGMPSPPRRRSLLWQLFAAEAAVLAAALLILILAPIQVSTTAVVTEVLILVAGLAVMLAFHLVLLRRTLAPLRLLTDVIGALDARDPGRLPAVDARSAEVAALAEAFNSLLDRLDEERLRSARRALLAQEDERRRIAREMHDQVGQTLTALTIQAERGASMEGPVDRALFERIAATALQSLDDVRRIGRELRPEALDDLGLGNALIALCRRMDTPGGVRVTPVLEPGLPQLEPEVELVIYRVAQEAVTNALRHANAREVHVSLHRAGDRVELTVQDDGRGIPDELPSDTAGISGMRERAALVGAELAIGRAWPNGTEVRLTL